MGFPASLTIVFVLLSLVPGWLYLRWAERTRPAEKLSGLNEIMQVLAVGLSTTGIAVLIVALLPRGWLVDPGALLLGGRAYVGSHFQRVALSIALAFGLAVLMAGLLYLGVASRSRGGFRTRGNPWVDAFDAPRGMSPMVMIEMSDGRQIGGWLRSYAPEKDTKPDLVLQGRIKMALPGTEQWTDLVTGRFVVAGDQIVAVKIVDGSIKPAPKSLAKWWDNRKFGSKKPEPAAPVAPPSAEPGRQLTITLAGLRVGVVFARVRGDTSHAVSEQM